MKRLDEVDLILTLSFPAIMTILAILDNSPYSTWLAWGGWLFMLLYVLFILVFRNRRIERNEPVTRRNTTIQLAIRLVLLLLVPGQLSLDTLQAYFYASTAGAALSIVVALIVAFIHKSIRDPKLALDFGIGLLLLVLTFIGLSTYPFIAEIVRYYSGKDGTSITYLLVTFVIEFSSVYIIFARHIKSDESAIGPDVKNESIFVVIILGWLIGFATLAGIFAG